MAARRKLNIPQLVTLCEVYWDDAAKLAEILEELRARLEPEAEALFRTVSGRIHLLKTDPAAAKAQPPPTQQADAPHAVAPMVTARAAPSRRRAVAIAAVLAAVGIAAWLLWPHRAAPPQPTKADAGPEIALGGAHEDERPKSPGEQPTPPSGTRRVVRDQPDTPMHSSGGGSGGGASVPRPRLLERRLKDEGEAPEAGETREVVAGHEPRDARAGASPRSSRAAAAANGRSANRGRMAESLAGAAEAGVAVDDARLTCYRSDSHAASCDAPPNGTDAPPSAVGARAPATPDQAASSSADPPLSGPATAAANRSSGSSTTPRSASPGSPQDRQPPPSAPPSQSGGDGSPAGGADSSGGAGGGASSRGERETTNPPVPTQPSQPSQSPISSDAAIAAAPPPNCPPAPTEGRVVFILDGSVSMGLPLDVDADLEDELDDGIRHHDAEARREYRALLAAPGPKRITRARAAFAAAAADLPPKVELGLVVFQECRDIRKVGVFEAARRGKAVDYIRALVPKGRTPIADSLRRAAEMLGNGPSSIVLLTDGREFCGGDPCAAAAEINAAHPHTRVSIVDITGEARAECVAEITGGRSYQPDAAEDLARVVTAAFRGADPLCAAGEGSAPAAR